MINPAFQHSKAHLQYIHYDIRFRSVQFTTFYVMKFRLGQYVYRLYTTFMIAMKLSNILEKAIFGFDENLRGKLRFKLVRDR